MELLTITIETDDRSLSADYMGVRRGVIFDEGGTRLVFDGFRVRKGADVLSDALSFIIEVSKNIEFGLIATYLYDKVKNRPATRLTIRKTVVEEITPEGIKRVLKEEIEGPINRD